MTAKQKDIVAERRVIHTTAPATNELLRSEIYRGLIFRLPANEQSKKLTEYVVSITEQHLGEDPRKAQFSLGRKTVFEEVGKITKELRNEEFVRLVHDTQRSWGFEPEENPICGVSKGVRFRAHVHTETNKESYFGIYHRETWFGHPQVVINWWMPLFDAVEDETFSFYPDWFETPIVNNSAGFDASKWYKELGDNWGRNEKSSDDYHGSHPRVTDDNFEPRTRLKFAAKAGDMILFSGQHVHKTNSEVVPYTRFNLDFRTYNLHDKAANLGPKNIDNEISAAAMLA